MLKHPINNFVLKSKQKTRVLGLMSGTSLDGLDMALCEFWGPVGKPSFKILAAKTSNYSPALKKRLSLAQTLNAEDYFAFNAEYGTYMAQKINAFLKGKVQPSLIASHGHTVFHQPKRGFSTQLGCGANIAAKTGIPTVCDFRSLDVALGGQGAPLVPIGDELLFTQYQACLNIGGIANISFRNKQGKRVAFDICAANMALNYLSEKIGKKFDKGGRLASEGIIIPTLLKQLNKPAYFSKKGVKSMGREWFEKNMLALIENSKYDIKDILATCSEHCALMIARAIEQQSIKQVLVTGGGAYNTYLIKQIRIKTKSEIIIPDKGLVNFKEAIIFAFLGYKRFVGETNTLKSVTGAKRDSNGGALYNM